MPDFAFELESLDETPEEHKALYKESDGKFRLNLAAYDEYIKAPVVKKNKELLGKLSQNKGLERLEKFKDVTDEEWEAFLHQKDAQANGGAGGDGKGNLEELKAKWQTERVVAEKKLKDAHVQALAAKDAEIQQWQKKYQSFAMRTQLQALALKAGVIAERLEDFIAVHRDRFQLDEKGELAVLDADGDPDTIKPEQFIGNTLRDQKPWYFQAVEQGGSGSQGSGGNTGARAKTMKRAAFDGLPEGKKREFFKSGGKVVD